MSLPDVLLSLLREPMSGSELIRLFQGSIDHFWNTDLSQIYRALDALERRGCVVSRSVPSPRGPERKVYELTDAGRTRLHEWVTRPLKIPTTKFEYLAQLFSSTAMDNPGEHARSMLAAFRSEAESALRTLEAIDGHMREIFGEPETMPDELFYPWLTLRHGLLRRRSLIDWIDESLTLLGRRKETACDPASMRKLMMALGLAEPGPQDTPDKQESR